MSDEKDKQKEAAAMVSVTIEIPQAYYDWVTKLAEMGNETDSAVCGKMVQVALLDIEKRAKASIRPQQQKSPIITKVGSLDQVRSTLRSNRGKKIIH